MARMSIVFSLAFIILNAHPLSAIRDFEKDKNIEKAFEFKSEMQVDLEQAMEYLRQTMADESEAERDSGNATHLGKSTDDCPDLLNDFGKNIHMMHKSVDELELQKDKSAMTMATLVSRTLIVAKSMERAKFHEVKEGLIPGFRKVENKPCSWTTDPSEIPAKNTDELKTLYSKLQASNPCFQQAQNYLDQDPTTDKGKPELQDKTSHALLIMLADPGENCKPSEVPTTHESIEDLDKETGGSSEREGDGTAINIMNIAAKVTGSASLAEMTPSDNNDTFVRAGSFQVLLQKADSQLRTTMENRAQAIIATIGQKSVSDTLFEPITMFLMAISFIIFLFIVAVLCAVIATFIIGFILCLIKYVALWIANIFIAQYGTKSMLYSPGIIKCAGWWVAKKIGDDGFLLGICVRAMMKSKET